MHPCAARPLSSVHPFCAPRLIAMTLLVMAGLPAIANGNVTTHNGATAPTIAWTRQLGTSESESGRGVTIDGLGNVFITGVTTGGLGGNTNAGGWDAFISRYSQDGTLVWTRQLGTSGWDLSHGVAADGLGNVYISGETQGGIGGNSLVGGTDAFVSRYALDGSLTWTRQLGTIDHDLSAGVAADGLGNVFISGLTHRGLAGNASAGSVDAFVSKYTPEGFRIWTKQLGTSVFDASNHVAADGLGNVYIVGQTNGDLDGNTNAGPSDAFVSRYDQTGTLIWTQQLGSSDWDSGLGVTADGMGNIYITGYTEDALDGHVSAGGADAFISKYTQDGALAWTRQLGSSGRDFGLGVAADGLGNVYITGRTDGDIDGNANAGGRDAFVSKYTEEGSLAWTQQLGTSTTDSSLGVAADGLGNIYITGGTEGSLDGNVSAGESDAFLIKLHDPDAVAIDGDVTGDGFVGAEDLDVLLANWGASVGGNAIAAGDLSRDGIVGQDDLNIVITNWGNGTPPTHVPEPGTVAVFGLCGFAFLRRR